MAQHYIILRRSHCQVTNVPGQAQHITAEYSADSRNRTPRAKVGLHIQKPKPQASIKNKIKKIRYDKIRYDTLILQTLMDELQLQLGYVELW